MHVSATDEHDEAGILISDEHTNAAIRRKMHEKRMRKMDGVLEKLAPPALEGPADADVTLVGWGSTWGVIQEAVARLADGGISASHLHFRVLHPFHEKEARQILDACTKTIAVEANYDGQFARHLRAETGFTVDHVLTRYDGEPFEPDYVVERVQRLLEGEPLDLAVSEEEAREMAYHYVRLYLKDAARPVAFGEAKRKGIDEPLWEVELAARKDGETQGTLLIGRESGSVHGFEEASA